MGRTWRRVVLVALASAGSACTWTHRCTVPSPVVEAAPGRRLPLAVEVRHAPPAVSPEVKQKGGTYGEHAIVVDATAPTRALFGRLAASMFERTAPPPPAELVLELRLDRFRLGTQPFGPVTSEVGYHATFRTPDGIEVAAFDVEGAATVAPELRHLGFCGARGEAAALAMQQAGAGLLRAVPASAPLATWLRARGIDPPAFTVRPIEAYAATDASASTPASPASTPASPAPTPPALPSPLRAGPPPAPVRPRAYGVRLGAGAFRPETTAGKLEDPSSGLGSGTLGFGTRLLEWLTLDLPLEYVTRSYSARSVPHLTGFGPRTTLDSTSFGPGLRVTPPLGERPLVEPWLGAAAHLVYTRLTVTYFGGLSGGDAAGAAWSLGAELGAGLNVYPGGPFVLGFEVRRRFGRASLDPVGRVGIGGVVVGGSVGVALPP